MNEDEVASGGSPISQEASNFDEADDYNSIPLSPRSELYRSKYTRLKEKFDYIRLSNNRLRNRLYHVKKEINRLKRLKRILCYRLMLRGDNYMDTHLDIPVVMAPSAIEKLAGDSCSKGSSKKRKVADVKRVAPVSEVEEIMTMEQKARSSVISIIDSVITESHEERMRANAATESNETKPFDRQIDMSDTRTEMMLRPSSIDHLLPQDPDSDPDDPGDVLNEFGETLDKNFMAED